MKDLDLHPITPQQRYIHYTRLSIMHLAFGALHDHIVVSTLRCGCNNPGSHPDHGILLTVLLTVCPLQYISKYVLNILLITQYV